APSVRTVCSLPIPVVSLMNGLAAGAGAKRALACDIVLATRSASFIEPFCKLGLIPDTGGTYFQPRQEVGATRVRNEAELAERLDETRRSRGKHDIAGERPLGPCTGRKAIHEGDHRNRQRAHGPHRGS